MDRPVRVRFAPSPTGELHVGSVRTALFNWLLARHTGGVFVLRIEDTDQVRKVEGAEEAILDGLRWMGLDWDEGPDVSGPYGPYIQSQRRGHYRQAMQRLVTQGYAYLCYCTTQRLEEMRAEQARNKLPPKYDRRCRNLTPTQRADLEGQGFHPVVRFKTPLEGRTSFYDLIRGEIVVENATLDDFVIIKSDGLPTYNFANVVDDHLMEITHVLRGDEFLASTPRHMLLYQVLGYEPPEFAHLPLILGPDRAKLSKRHGAASIVEYQRQGYLPEALVNFLALLGWSLDDKTEMLGRNELVQNFSIERIGKTGAVFDGDKLEWMNGVYLRALPAHDLAERLMPFLERDLPSSVARPLSRDYVERVAALEQERLKRLGEAAELTQFFFLDTLEYDPALLVGKELSTEATAIALQTASERLRKLAAFDSEALEGLLRPLAAELELKTGQLFGILRVAVTGRTAAPPLFQTMAVLGREQCLGRLAEALSKLGSAP